MLDHDESPNAAGDDLSRSNKRYCPALVFSLSHRGATGSGMLPFDERGGMGKRGWHFPDKQKETRIRR